MKKLIPFWEISLATTIFAALLAPSAQAQFQWDKRIASAASWPEGEPNIGMTLDTNGNCYVTGWFDGINDFGGITLTNQSIGGSDIFVAKYNNAGTLQWVQRAGGSPGNSNYGRAVGLDTNGNVYVTGSAYGAANFGTINLTGSSGQNFFLAKYNTNGTVQWVKPSSGGSSDVYGIGLAVDGAGNSYALVTVDYGQNGSISFGSTTVPIPANIGTPLTIFIKYDDNGNVIWTQVLGSSTEVYAPKVTVDASGYIYVRGIFISDMTIGTSNLLSSASSKNFFVAKFSNSGNLIWVQQPQGIGFSDGGLTVDLAGNVYVSGMFEGSLDFGAGITLTNAGSYNSYLAKYNSAGAIQWAQKAGGTNDGAFAADVFFDLALDGQTNIYAAGDLNSYSVLTKYDPTGREQWTYLASGSPASPISSTVWRCVVDSSKNCYLAGLYGGTDIFGTNVLQPQEAWNFFLAKLTVPLILSSPQIVGKTNFTFQLSGPAGSNYVLQVSTNLLNWSSVSTSTIPVSGSTNLSNAISGYKQSFYRVLLQ